jgi:phosphomevalonate kinase
MVERDPIVSQNELSFNSVGVLITGKRFAGKDTFALALHRNLSQNYITSAIKQTAQFLKERFCRLNNLDLDLFLTDRNYKEKYRQQLTDFVLVNPPEENMDKFIESLRDNLKLTQVTIISDIRNILDKNKLSEVFPNALTIRITTSDENRVARGFQHGAYDESVFETAIDLIPADILIINNNSLAELQLDAKFISRTITNFLKS